MLKSYTDTPAAIAPPRLPLVAMEQYMLVDDRPAYPMTFFLRLILDGQLQRGAFERALAAAVRRHPLLSATIEPKPGRWRYWTWNCGPAPKLFWNDETEPVERYLDLTREPGLRVKVDVTGDSTTLLLQMHHCCCDGLGVLTFIEDLLAAYADEMTRPDDPSSEITPRESELPSAESLHALRNRARFGLGWLGLLLRLPLEVLGLLGTLEFFSIARFR